MFILEKSIEVKNVTKEYPGIIAVIAAAASPVPGGVGTVTTSMIMLNLVKAVKLQLIKLR